MTHEETIEALDNLIVYLNSAILKVKLSRYFKDNVIGKLQEINVSNATMQAIAKIEIKEYNSNSLSHYVMDLQHLEKERIETNKQSIQSMIDILKVEKERHKQMVIEEEKQRILLIDKKNLELQETAIDEQKKGNKIQKIAFVVTTAISLIALIAAIFK